MQNKYFPLVKEIPAQIYLEPNDRNYEGLRIIAESFVEDVNLVTCKTPKIITDESKLAGAVVIVGTIGENSLINKAISKGLLDANDIEGKWECYKISFIENLTEQIDKALIIVGSDKRGCIYGLYHISEMMGVSPWVWFADAVPAKKETVLLNKRDIETTSHEPSVRYRGIFINDESPSFTSWANGKYGQLNEKMYAHVFELILRLKGNYLWPAMWSNNFSEDGLDDKYANIKLANTYGVVMGASHHEPMCRAGVEWQRIYKKYSDNNSWDFSKNRDAISEFWKDGIIRNHEYENIINLGMRGENDSHLAGSFSYNVQLLKDIILTQKDILVREGLQDVPKMFVVYKEVEKYWNGGIDKITGEEVEGLKHWKNEDGTSPLDDVIVMLCEDNYGNVRSLPKVERKGGWGMYYHFDYNGAPRSYMWINVMQLEKTWEQLSEAFDYGVRDVWIVNVGDIKPMEMQMSYYMNLAYDFDTYGTNAKIKPGQYYSDFARQQFSYGLSEMDIEGIAQLLADYSKLNGICKPEYAREDIYSLEIFNEAKKMLAWCLNIKERSNELKKRIPIELQDAYYQLIYYPAVASANITIMYIYSAYNKKYAAEGNILANSYAKLVEECITYDRELQDYYNNTMSKGKWKGMMSQIHYGYTEWHPTSAQPLKPVYIEETNNGKRLTCEIESVQLDCIISNEYNQKETPVIDNLPSGTYVESNGYISISSEDFTYSKATTIETTNEIKKTEWKVIPNYGRTSASIKIFPTTESYSSQADALENGEISKLDTPYVEYTFYITEGGEYTLRSYTAPSNNLDGDVSKLRYGVSFDRGVPLIVDSLPNGFIAGDFWNHHWCEGVRCNIHLADSMILLSPGLHTLQFYGVDSGLVLQKLVLYKGELPKSYLGPDKSYLVKK